MKNVVLRNNVSWVLNMFSCFYDECFDQYLRNRKNKITQQNFPRSAKKKTKMFEVIFRAIFHAASLFCRSLYNSRSGGSEWHHHSHRQRPTRVHYCKPDPRWVPLIYYKWFFLMRQRNTLQWSIQLKQITQHLMQEADPLIWILILRCESSEVEYIWIPQRRPNLLADSQQSSIIGSLHLTIESIQIRENKKLSFLNRTGPNVCVVEKRATQSRHKVDLICQWK